MSAPAIQDNDIIIDDPISYQPFGVRNFGNAGTIVNEIEISVSTNKRLHHLWIHTIDGKRIEPSIRLERIPGIGLFFRTEQKQEYFVRGVRTDFFSADVHITQDFSAILPPGTVLEPSDHIKAVLKFGREGEQEFNNTTVTNFKPEGDEE
ncbi:hypothetical protein TWF481_001239 [Arthrobotrys musiformis]|uniref:Uncharacterized protein n=1 Tax=Arthrobotrys musiformis TaxID=47236 RepID=A0AAV9WQ90_9PEZI